jgi:thiamine-phosphate pyrophosphorylase
VKPLPFRLLLITDWQRPDCLARLSDALDAGPGLAVLHRHPGAPDRLLMDEGLRLAELCARRGVPLFVGGRLDLALALGANLHLPARALAPVDVRPHLRGLLTAAWHPAEEPAPPQDVHALLVSPVFAPGSKAADARAPLGARGYFAARERAAGIPCLALGGISREGLAALRAEGAVDGAAVISAVLHAPSPARAAAELLTALGDAPRVPPQPVAVMAAREARRRRRDPE